MKCLHYISHYSYRLEFIWDRLENTFGYKIYTPVVDGYMLFRKKTYFSLFLCVLLSLPVNIVYLVKFRSTKK